MSAPSRRPGPAPDVEISAGARVERLRFDQVPETDVTFPGASDQESGSQAERENLPERVEPGVTYRDVRMRWRAAARAQPSSRRTSEHEPTREERPNAS